MRKVSNSIAFFSLLTRRRSTSFSSSLVPKTRTSNSLFNNNQCTKPHQFLAEKTDFIAIPFRNTSTFIKRTSQVPSRQRKSMEKSNLEEALDSAETSLEMVKIFNEMERVFEERELGLASLKIGLTLEEEGEDPEKALSFAHRALKALGSDDSDSIPKLTVAMALQLLGSVNFGLKRFADSLGYLNRANRVLDRLQVELFATVDDVSPVLYPVQLQLANVKNAMGRREEAFEHLRKCLEIDEEIFKEDAVELGKANRKMAEAYVLVLNFKEALQYCTKALEIHEKHLGRNSVEVAHDRKLLGIIYSWLDEHEKAQEQNVWAQRVFKNWNLNDDLLRAEIDAANMMIASGRCDEAIGALTKVVQQTDKDSETRALVLLSMAKALSNQEKFADCKKCLKICLGILYKTVRISPVALAEANMEISLLYETMNQFETGISLLKRALALFVKLRQ